MEEIKIGDRFRLTGFDGIVEIGSVDEHGVGLILTDDEDRRYPWSYNEEGFIPFAMVHFKNGATKL